MHRVAVARRRHVAQENRGVVLVLDRNMVEFVYVNRAAVERDHIFVVAELCGATRQNYVGGLERVEHILWRDSFCVKPRRVEVQHHLAGCAAERSRALHPWQREEKQPDKVEHVIVELHLRQRLAGADDVDDRNVSRVEIQDGRGCDALGQDVLYRIGDRG